MRGVGYMTVTYNVIISNKHETTIKENFVRGKEREREVFGDNKTS